MEIICNEKELEKALYIIPVNYSNIGRFFNGINNKSLQKPNLRTMRCKDPETNECRVLIYTSNSIKKGEEMLFDYNAGAIQQGKDLHYDTT